MYIRTPDTEVSIPQVQNMPRKGVRSSRAFRPLAMSVMPMLPGSSASALRERGPGSGARGYRRGAAELSHFASVCTVHHENCQANGSKPPAKGSRSAKWRDPLMQPLLTSRLQNTFYGLLRCVNTPETGKHGTSSPLGHTSSASRSKGHRSSPCSLPASVPAQFGIAVFPALDRVSGSKFGILCKGSGCCTLPQRARCIDSRLQATC